MSEHQTNKKRFSVGSFFSGFYLALLSVPWQERFWLLPRVPIPALNYNSV